MSDSGSKPIINTENLPTVTAVAFIVALLALVLSVKANIDARRVGGGVMGLHQNDVGFQTSLEKDQARIQALESKVAALEAAAAAAATPAAPADPATAPK